MEWRKIPQGFLIKLEKGEELVEQVTSFSKEHKVEAGLVEGIGAVQKVELGFYSLEQRKYLTRVVKDVEIASLTGNISLVEGVPHLHVHGVFSDKGMKAFGGHVMKAVVAATCEIVLTTLGKALERKEDKDVGLKLWDL